MATEIHKTWNDVLLQMIDMVEELQTWRDYEEEVSYGSDRADQMTDAIDALLALVVSEVK